MFNQDRDMDLWRPPWKLICDGIMPEGNAEGNFEAKLFDRIIKDKIQMKQARAHYKSANRGAEGSPRGPQNHGLTNFKKPALKAKAAARLAAGRKTSIASPSIIYRELESPGCIQSASSFGTETGNPALNIPKVAIMDAAKDSMRDSKKATAPPESTRYDDIPFYQKCEKW